MTGIQTFLKQDGSFVPVDEYAGTLPDEDYVEGAIELRIHGKPLLTTDQADYVDQLWAYLVQGFVEEVMHGRVFSTYFPDCPIQVTLRPDAGMQRIAVAVDLRDKRGPRSATTSFAEFKAEFVRAARHFFETIRPLMPSHEHANSGSLHLLSKL